MNVERPGSRLDSMSEYHMFAAGLPHGGVVLSLIFSAAAVLLIDRHLLRVSLRHVNLRLCAHKTERHNRVQGGYDMRGLRQRNEANPGQNGRWAPFGSEIAETIFYPITDLRDTFLTNHRLGGRNYFYWESGMEHRASHEWSQFY